MNAEASQGNSLRPCPFCGHLESATADHCRRCRLALDQKALHGLKRLMGVWHLLDERSPTGPGVSWQKFCQLIASDRVYENSIIRGPATHGVWQYAQDTPSVATLLGLCWSCHCRLPDGRATHCPRCEVELNGPLDWPPTEESKGVEEPIAALPAEEDLLAAGTGEREFRNVSGGMTWKDLLLRLLGFLVVGAACAGVFWYSFLFAWHGRLVGPDERIAAVPCPPGPAAKPAAEEKHVAVPSLPAQEQAEGETDSAPPLVAALTPPPAPAAPTPPVSSPPAPATQVAPAKPAAAAPTPAPAAPAVPTPPAPGAAPARNTAPLTIAEPPRPVIMANPNLPQEETPAPVPAAPAMPAPPVANKAPLTLAEPRRPVILANPNLPQDTPAPVPAASAAPATPAGNRSPLAVAEPPRPVVVARPNEPQPMPMPVPVAPAGTELAAVPSAAPAATPATRPAEPEQPEPEGAREIYSAKIIFAIARQAQADGDLVKAEVLLREMMATHDKKVWPDDANDMLQSTQRLIRTSPRPKDPAQTDVTRMWQEARELSDEALKLEKQNDLPQAFNKLAMVIYRYPSTVWPKTTFECFRRVIHNMRKQDLPPLP